ncbi:MAG: hypothetical protein CL434_11270 [Acidimicrobiaceae bacterium]|nr:hypothetical protein [Acidimicrobiaceae bacterium]
MPHEVRGVVAKSKGAPVSVETIHVPDPGPGEVVVDVQACGVCHTDLHYREGAINDEFPFLLGHEAAGTVTQTGAGVASLKEGDFVVLNWRAVCGECRSCLRGKPQYCFSTHNAQQKMIIVVHLYIYWQRQKVYRYRVLLPHTDLQAYKPYQ